MIRLSATGREAASGEAAVFPQHLLALLGRRRNREVIALDLVAAVRGEQLELLLRFHAFGYDLEFEAVREADDRERDHRVLRIGCDVANEGVVDLERVDRKTLQVREARIARAEIVHRDLHPRVLQPAQRARSALRIAHQQRLGELELDERRIDARFAQDVPYDGLEILLLELARGEVHRHGQYREPAPLPFLNLRAHVAQHRFAHRHDQARVLQNRNEFPREDQTLLGMPPAQQRLETADEAGLERHLGLVVEEELLLIDRPAQRRLHPHARERPLVHLAGEVLVGIAALFLGAIHGGVGVHDQGLGVVAVGREQGDADARADIGVVRIELERPAEGVQDFLRNDTRVPRLREVRHDRAELVAAEPAHRIAAAHALRKTVGRFLEQLVPGAVPLGVVHELEAVEVDEEHRHGLPAAPRVRHGFQQAVVKEVPVGEPGERVELREAHEALLRTPALDRDRQYVRHALQETCVVQSELALGARVRAEYSERSGRSEYGDLDAAAHAQAHEGRIRESLVLRQIFGDERLAARQHEFEAAARADGHRAARHHLAWPARGRLDQELFGALIELEHVAVIGLERHRDELHGTGEHVLDVGARERLLAELRDEALPQRLVVDSLLGLFARADVGHRADHAHRPSCAVQDHLAAVEHVDETAVGPPEPVLVAPVLPARADHAMYAGDDPPLIVGMNALVPGFDRVIRGFARMAEYLGEVLVPPDFVGEQVPVPDHVVGGPHRHVETLVALAQGLFACDALADIARGDDDDPAVPGAHHAPPRFERQLRAVLAAVFAPHALRRTGRDHLVVSGLQVLAGDRQDIFRGHREKRLARVPELPANGFVHVDKAHRLAVDEKDHVVRHVHGSAKAQQRFLASLALGDVPAYPAVAAETHFGIEDRLAAYAGDLQLARAVEAVPLQVAERLVRLQQRAVRRPGGLGHVERGQFPAGLSDDRVRYGSEAPVEIVGNHGEAEVLVLLPIPVR